MTETSPTPPAAPEPEADEAKGYAVYDSTLARFVTGVYDTKAKANDALSKASGHKYETRKV